MSSMDGHADDTLLSKTEYNVSTEQDASKEEVASTSGMQLNNVSVNKLSIKQLVRAAMVMLMWRKFFARKSQLLLYLALADYSLGGCSVTLCVDDNNHCKCLNNTSRATSVKLEAANLLTSQSCLFVLAARTTAGSIRIAT